MQQKPSALIIIGHWAPLTPTEPTSHAAVKTTEWHSCVTDGQARADDSPPQLRVLIIGLLSILNINVIYTMIVNKLYVSELVDGSTYQSHHTTYLYK